MIEPSAPDSDGGATRPVTAYVPVMELRTMQVRRDEPGLVRVASHVALLAIGGAAIAVSRHTPWVIAAWVFEGYVIAHLFALLHECSHRTAFKTPWLNAAVAFASGYAILQPPLHFRREHVAHHAYTQDFERDPELIRLPDSLGEYLLFLSGLPYWWYVVSGIGAHVVGRLRPGEASFLRSRSDKLTVFREARFIAAVYVIVIAASIVAGSDAFFVYWLIPRIIGEPVMRVHRMAEHAGRPLVRDVTRNTRTLKVPAALRWIDYNMSFHAEHHAAPAVPFHALPRLHDRFAPHVLNSDGGVLAAHLDIVRRIRYRTGPGLEPTRVALREVRTR